MTWLIAGLVIFLAMHSIRILGEAPRAALIGRIGETSYKGAYSIVSLAGLVLIGQGYEAASAAAGLLYVPPASLSAVTLIVVPIAFVLVTAAYAPAGYIKYAVRHPMAAGVALWAFGHLLANGGGAEVILFAGFLLWAMLDFAAAVRRNPRPVAKADITVQGDVFAVVIGLVGAAFFIVWAHQWLFGVSPVA